MCFSISPIWKRLDINGNRQAKLLYHQILRATLFLIGAVLCLHLWTSGSEFQKILKALFKIYSVLSTKMVLYIQFGWAGLSSMNLRHFLWVREGGKDWGKVHRLESWKSVLESAPVFHSSAYPYALWCLQKKQKHGKYLKPNWAHAHTEGSEE